MMRLLFTLLILALSINQVYANRYALVIGNSDYGADLGSLKNPVNDAYDMSTLLNEKGFSVIKLINASQREMEQGISKFTKQLNEKNSVGLFFFAGHGISLNGSNYLIPIGANIKGEGDVKYEAVDSGRVMSGMQYAGNNLNMVILDACRNNPFARNFRSISRGLVRVEPPKGSLVLYATSPGEVAADGNGRNGVFTQHLLAAMDTPNINIEQVFKVTANNVYNATNKNQLPWQTGVILGEFYFSEKDSSGSKKINNTVEKIEFLQGIEDINSLSYSEYRNQRFLFSIIYPTDILYPQGEPDNSDGQYFLSKDTNIKLTCSARYSMDETLEYRYRENIFEEKNRSKKSVITYKIKKNDWFVISGIDNVTKNIFYQKVFLVDGIFKQCSITFPENRKDKMDNILSKIFNKFIPR